MRVLVTGGAGFLGSHLCDALIARGDEVVCLDNLSTGRRENVAHLGEDPAFAFVQADVTDGLRACGAPDAIAHLASPASPPEYLRHPIETLAAGSTGTWNALELARDHGARFLMASTSEIYGEPLQHPQSEEYWGNVNPIGPRSVYDEAKRFSEALTAAHGRELGVNVGIVRIFNTYGPRMRVDDGRIVSNFIRQALAGDPLTVYGDGSQTRSFCYVDDLVRGLIAMLDCSAAGPVNLGNPQEMSVAELAKLVVRTTGSRSALQYSALPVDDPTRRRPDITAATHILGWEPKISLEEGLERTIRWFGSAQPADR